MNHPFGLMRGIGGCGPGMDKHLRPLSRIIAGYSPQAMKVLYKPFAVIAGIIGAKLGESLFRALWAKLDGDDPPKPTRREATTGKVVAAAALEAAAHSGAKAATTRASARSFHYLTGYWPGDQATADGAKSKQKR
jgi:Protein of unknown function (DUF4235)